MSKKASLQPVYESIFNEEAEDENESEEAEEENGSEEEEEEQNLDQLDGLKEVLGDEEEEQEEAKTERQDECLIKLPEKVKEYSDTPRLGLVEINGKGRPLHFDRKRIIQDHERSHNVFQEHGFEIGITLGKGTFSRVVMAHWKKYKLNVAVKIYDKSNPGAEVAIEMLPGEIEALIRLKHPNVITFLGAWETKFRVYLVFELLGNQNLLTYLSKHGAVNEAEAKVWFAQLISAVKYCHDREVAHRDIKCENLLLDMAMNLKLSDFGFAVSGLAWEDSIPNRGWIKLHTFCGSPAYMAPEILRRNPYSPFLTDVWAVGVVLYCMLFKQFPFNFHASEESRREYLNVMNDFTFPDQPAISSDCEEIMKKIFVHDDSRLRAYQVVKLAWLGEMKYDLEMAEKGKMTFQELWDREAKEAEIMADPTRSILPIKTLVQTQAKL